MVGFSCEHKVLTHRFVDAPSYIYAMHPTINRSKRQLQSSNVKNYFEGTTFDNSGDEDYEPSGEHSDESTEGEKEVADNAYGKASKR